MVIDPREFGVTHSVDRIDGKFRRAEEHFETFKRMASAYINDEVDGIRAKIRHQRENDVGVHFETKPRRPRPMIDMAVVVGDVIHNLRSGLDHLAWELVVSNGGTPDENTCFPIRKVGPTSDRHGRTPPPHVSGGVDPAALQIIESVQPYVRKPRNPRRDTLFWLHELSKEDKHRGLMVGLPHQMVVRNSIHVDPWFKGALHTGQLRVTHMFEGGAHAAFVPDDSQVTVEGLFTFEICLSKGTAGLPKPIPVVPGLEAMIDEVRANVFLPLAPFLVDVWEPLRGGPLRPT